MKIQALLFDGFDELDFFGVFEPLRMANFDVTTRSLYDDETVQAAYGTRISVDAPFSLGDKPDLLLLPGGGWLSRSSQGAWAEAEKGDILDLVRECHSAGVILASVCTGSLILARAGLLDGRPATTNHAAVNELIELGAKFVPARVVDDGNIVTASGITASLDLGLWLVERFASQSAALIVSSKLEFEPRGLVAKAVLFM